MFAFRLFLREKGKGFNLRMISGIAVRVYFKLFSWWYLRKSKSVLDEKWDNLIILDACRYDIFEKHIKKKDNLRPFYSLGSHTAEFILRNFEGKELPDIIYLTANPHSGLVSDVLKRTFFKVIPLWKTHWNKKYGTVLPRDVVAVSKKIKRKYPHKKQIIHFMQPHFPSVKHVDLIRLSRKYKKENPTKVSDPWHLALDSLVSIEKVWEAYEDNLDYVLPYALHLALWFKEEYRETTVITSDHGNAYRKIYFPVPYFVVGHPYGIYIEDLIKVPWYKLE